MTRRRQRVLVVAITAVALLRGMWWVVTTPVWSPIDEQAHFDFVAALGRGDYPIVGESRVHPDVLALAKHSSTSPWQSVPVPPDPARSEWGALGHSYEAAQPPLYYGLLAPLARATSGAATLTSVYALRVVSLLVSLALVPLVWLLGRELFPTRPEVGVSAGAVTALLSGVNGNFAVVANDGLMTVLSAAALLVTARVMQRGFTTRRAVAVGLLVGAAVLTKLTALSLVAVVAVGVGVAMRRQQALRPEIVRFAMVSGVFAAVVIAPWVAWNLATYGGLTASGELDAITGSLQSDPPMNLGGVVTRLGQAAHGFWDQQLLDVSVSRYGWLWFGFVSAIGAAAFLVQRGTDRAVLAWLFGAWPIAFAVMLFLIIGASGGRSDIVGRHLYVALPALVLAATAAAFFAAERWGFVLVAAVAAIGLTFEARDAPGILRAVYADDAVANLAPVVDQPYADRAVVGRRFDLTAPCPAVALRLVFRDDAPIVSVNGESSEPFAPEPLEAGAVAALYEVPGGPREISVDVPAGARVAVSDRGPAHRVFCVQEDNLDARFAQTFRREHPPLTYKQVAAVPRMWAAVGWMVVVASAARNVARRPR